MASSTDMTRQHYKAQLRRGTITSTMTSARHGLHSSSQRLGVIPFVLF